MNIIWYSNYLLIMILITVVHPLITNNRVDWVSVKVYSRIHGILIIIIDAISAVIIVGLTAAWLLKGAVNIVRLKIADHVISRELLKQGIIFLWTDVPFVMNHMTIIFASFIIGDVDLVIQQLICRWSRYFSARKRCGQFYSTRTSSYLSLSSEVLLLFTKTVRMMATMIKKMITLRILMVMTVLVLTSFFSRQGMSPS